MSESQFDVAIIGGGISGIGTALAAASNGLKTIIFEKGEMGKATSNNSLRIIHGGFRYLQNFNIPRVVQSLKDQNYLLDTYPHLITPLPCLMPLNNFAFNKSALKSPIPAMLGSLTYQVLKKIYDCNLLPRPVVLHRSKLPQDIPILKSFKNNYFLHWYDAAISDLEHFNAELVSELRNKGVVIKEKTKIKDFSAINAKKNY